MRAISLHPDVIVVTSRLLQTNCTIVRAPGSAHEAPGDLPAVGTGSHIDAIPNAGSYDGTVGVLGGLEAIRALQRNGFRPQRPIELLIFTAADVPGFAKAAIVSTSEVLTMRTSRSLSPTVSSARTSR